MATVGVLMFGGGVVAANIAYSPGLPLTGTVCITSHCGPAPYKPSLVTNDKNVFPPVCPRIAQFPGNVGQGPKMRTEDATFVSVKAPLLSADASPSTLTVDEFLAAANRNAVVSTAAAGVPSFVVFVLYKCSTTGLAEQFVRVPIDPKAAITLETIRVPKPPQR